MLDLSDDQLTELLIGLVNRGTLTKVERTSTWWSVDVGEGRMITLITPGEVCSFLAGIVVGAGWHTLTL